MKRTDSKITTDRCEIHLVIEEYENMLEQQKSLQQPKSYILVGPPGGPLARIEDVELDLLMLFIQRVQASGMMSRRMVPTCL